MLFSKKQGSLKTPQDSRGIIDPKSLAVASGVCIAITWSFFREFAFFPLALPFAICVYVNGVKAERSRQKNAMRRSCRDACIVLSSELAAGASLEQGICRTGSQLGAMWSMDSEFLKNWRLMERRIVMRESAEEAFSDFAKRTGLTEALELAGLISFSKRGAGRIGGLLKTFAAQLEQELSVEEEIAIKLTEKRLELGIMCVMPAFIAVYMQLSSYDLVSVLYETLWGRVFMSVCLLLYCLAYGLGRSFLRIGM